MDKFYGNHLCYLVESDLARVKVLARRVLSHPMDAHFWKKYKENSLNLLKFYRTTSLLDGQFSMSGWKSAQGKMVMSTTTATGVWWYTLLANFLVHYKSFLLYMYVWIIMLLNPALNNNNLFYYNHFEINCDPHN